MAGPEELLARMIEEAFNEPDADRRSAAIAELFAEDVVFADPEATVTGRDALTERVTGLLAQGPGLRFTPSAPFRGLGDLGMRPWRLGPPDGDPVLSGLDVVRVVDGRIAQLWTMLEG